MPPSMIHRLLPARQALLDLDQADARFIQMLRLGAIAHQAGRSVVDVLEAKLGCVRRARQQALVVETLGAMWPDPIRLARPCCGGLLPDESLIAGLYGCARLGNRPDFDRLVQEMLGDDARSLLFTQLRTLALMARVGAAPLPEARGGR